MVHIYIGLCCTYVVAHAGTYGSPVFMVTRGRFFAKNFPPKMSGKINIFLGKSFEKLFPQQITQNFLRKITSRRKNVRKIGPR
jgi:hypothetical protein